MYYSYILGMFVGKEKEQRSRRKIEPEFVLEEDTQSGLKSNAICIEKEFFPTIRTERDREKSWSK